MSEAVLRNYLRKIEKVYQAGNATEHSYRSSLQELMKMLDSGITATNEPKRIKCGAPDFIIINKQTPLGYIETKDIGISLDQVERTDQMKRYLGSLTNLILTDYVEFRWYVSGQHRMTRCGSQTQREQNRGVRPGSDVKGPPRWYASARSGISNWNRGGRSRNQVT